MIGFLLRSKAMKLPRPITCSEVGRREVLKALISHELNEEDENRLLEHLRDCPNCLSEMAAVIGESVMIYPNGCNVRLVD
jgi:hypothetical protein